MARINCIREMFFEKGMNYASIARVTGHDVKTVKKYVHQEDFNQPLPKPVKKRGSKLDKYKGDIDDWLEEDKKFHKKQRSFILIKIPCQRWLSHALGLSSFRINSALPLLIPLGSLFSIIMAIFVMVLIESKSRVTGILRSSNNVNYS